MRFINILRCENDSCCQTLVVLITLGRSLYLLSISIKQTQNDFSEPKKCKCVYISVCPYCALWIFRALNGSPRVQKRFRCTISFNPWVAKALLVLVSMWERHYQSAQGGIRLSREVGKIIDNYLTQFEQLWCRQRSVDSRLNLSVLTQVMTFLAPSIVSWYN